MNFRLEKTASNRVVSKFHVLNARGDIIGSINVKPSEEADLLAHWRGAAPAPAATSDKQGGAVAAMVRAAKQNRLSKQAVLRGC
jgi:hypothetical protein